MQKIPALKAYIKQKMFLLVPFLFLALGFFVFDNISAQAANYWVTNPANCPTTDSVNFPGQNCDTLKICGDNSGVAQCYNTNSINPPSASSTVSSNYDLSKPGGFLLNCYVSIDSGAPYCNNNGNLWCNASSTCTSVNRKTICNENAWASATCGTCVSGYFDCNGSGGGSDADGCEIQNGQASSTRNSVVYNGSCSSWSCAATYNDCDGDILANGCEVQDGGSCVSPEGIIGEYNGCSLGSGYCEVNSSYFTTGLEVRYATTSPLLWGTQYNSSGDIAFLSASNTPGGVFRITNDGRIGIGTSTIGTNDMLTVGMSANQQFIVSKTGVVTAGTWNGGIIGLEYGGTGLNLSDGDEGFLYISGGSAIASSTIDIAKTNLDLVNPLYWQSSSTIALNVSGDWTGTVDSVDIGAAAITWNAKWDSLDDMTLPQGNIYIGDGNNDPIATSSFFMDVNGNIGIGTTSPAAKFSLRQDSASDIVNIFDGDTEVFTILDGGNVGIGESAPTYPLVVARSSGNHQASIGYSINKAMLIGADSAGIGSLQFFNNGEMGEITTYADGSYMSFELLNSEKVRITASGYFGIGTSSPSQMLTVGATSSQQFLVNNIGQVVGGEWHGTVIAIDHGGTGTTTAPSIGQVLVGNGSGGYDFVSTSTFGDPTVLVDADFSSNGFMVRTAAGTYNTRLITGSSSQITITNSDGVSGNVEIGLSETVYLGANGKIGSNANNLIDFSTDGQITFRANGVNAMVLDANGYLGIGTSNPGKSLTVESAAGSQLRLAYDASNYVDFQVDSLGGLLITSSSGGGATTTIGSGESALIIDNDGNVSIGTSSALARLTLWGLAGMDLLSISSSTGDSLFFIGEDGNVGIGTTSPSQMLTVGATSSQQFLVNNIGQVVGGTWMGNAIGVAYGGTGQNWIGVAIGSLPYFLASGTMGTISIGSDNAILKVVNGLPTWQATSSLGFDNYQYWTANGNSGTANIDSIEAFSILGANGLVSAISGNNLTLQADNGYVIPLLASSTEWNSAYLSRLANVNGPLSFTNNELSITQATGTTDGYLSSTDWTSFNNKWDGLDDMTLPQGYIYVGNASNNPTATNNLYIDNNGNVGLGTSTPLSSLTVQGTAGINALNIASSTGESMLYIDQRGYIGIGTTAPSYKMTVNGILYADDIITQNTRMSNMDVGEDGLTLTGTPVDPQLITEIWENMNENYDFWHAEYVRTVGNYSYILANSAFMVFNTSSSTNPQFVAEVHDGDGIFSRLANAKRLYIDGNYAYVISNSDNALTIINISNPTSPRFVKELYNGDGIITRITSMENVFVSNGHAYVVSPDGYLLVLDVSNPYLPTNVFEIANTESGFNNLTGANHVFVSGNRLYISASSATGDLTIADITNPESPAVLKVVDSTIPGYDHFINIDTVFVEGNYAYVTASERQSLFVIDISSSTNPLLKSEVYNGDGEFNYLTGAHDVFVSGNYLYWAANVDGAIGIANISSSTDPDFITAIVDETGDFTKLYQVQTVHVANDILYAAGRGDNSFNVIDVSNPGSPALKAVLYDSDGDYPNIGGASSVYVAGNYAYVTGDNTLSIINISNIASPVLVKEITDQNNGAIDKIASVTDVFVSGNYAYLPAPDESSLTIIDISDPVNPVLQSEITDNAGGFDYLAGLNNVFVSGNYAYVAAEDTLTIIDVTDPANPALVSSTTDGTGDFTTIAGINDVFVLGNYAYVTANGGDWGMTVIDVTDPANPVWKSFINDDAETTNVFVSGNYAYVLDNGLFIVDISSSTNPTIVSTTTDNIDGFDFLAGTSEVRVSGNYAYVTAGTDNAMTIIDISTPASPTLVSTISDGDGIFSKLNGASDIEISGNYAFITSSGDSSLTIVDISGAKVNPFYATMINADKIIVKDEAFFRSRVTFNGDTNYMIMNGTSNYMLMDGETNYINFGRSVNNTMGQYGYGLRDVSGTVQVKHNGGSWNSVVGLGADGTQGQVAYFSADGTVVSGTSDLFIDVNNGNIGIGTTTPGSALTLGSGQFELPLGSAASPSIAFSNDLNTGIYGDGSGDVIISSNGTAVAYFDDTNNLRIQNGNIATPAYSFINDSDTGIFTDGNNVLGFSTNGTEVMRIDASGNVAIGTTTSSARLTIMKDDGAQLRLGYDNDTYVDFEVTSNGELTIIGSTETGSIIYIGDDSSENIGMILDGNTKDFWMGIYDADDSFRIGSSTDFGSSTLLTILSDGSVGIGTTSPVAKFSLRQDSAGDILNIFDGSTEVFTILDGGRIGIGTSSPMGTTTVTVAGSLYADDIYVSGNTFYMNNKAILSGNGSTLGLYNGSYKASLIASSGLVANLSWYLPTTAGYNKQFLSVDDGGQLKWLSPTALPGGDFSGRIGYDSFANFSNGLGIRNTSFADIITDKNPQINLKNIGTINSGSIHVKSGGTFATKVDYGAGLNAFDVLITDFNGDGYNDMAVPNGVDNDVSVLLNNGNGTFATKVDYGTGNNPTPIASGDFNNDGRSDLVVGNYDADTVSVLMNVASGTFATKVDYGTNDKPNGITVNDFNNDGIDDMAVSTYDSNYVSVFLNNGNGTFATKVDYGTQNGPTSISSGDFNGDGYNDLVSTNYSSASVSVFLNNGDGTFATKVDYTTNTSPMEVEVGDFNNDNKYDLAVTTIDNAKISVLLNNGNGTFAAKVDYSTLTSPYGVSVGDFNGDGYNDLVAANYGSGFISVYINNQNGTFATKVDYASGNAPRRLDVGDLDGDGKNDIAVVNHSDGDVSVYINQDSTVLFADAYTGNVSIGTSSALARLALWGLAGMDLLSISSSTGDNLFFIGEEGNVGIGTTSPSAKFAVNGLMYIGGTGTSTITDNLQVLGALKVGNSSTYINTNSILFSGASSINTTAGNLSFSLGSSGDLIVNTSQLHLDGATGNLGVGTTTATAKFALQGTAGMPLLNIASSTGASVFYIDQNGKLGVGTSSPTYQLDVAGNSTSYVSSFYNSDTSAGAGGLYIRSNGLGNLLSLNYNGSDVMTVNGAAATFNNPVIFNSAGDVSYAYDIVFTNNTSANVIFNSPGYVKTNSSYEDLDLTFAAANLGDVIVDDTFVTTGTSSLASILYANYQTSRVGVGTSSPLTTLSVQGTAGAPIMNVASSTGASLFYIDQAGRVGIGTTSPAAAFAVNGNALVNGSLSVTSLTISGSGSLSEVNITSSNGYKQDGYVILQGSTTRLGIFAGQEAGKNMATGTENSFFGYQAGYSATSSSNNTFIGARAGYLTTSGHENTFVGGGAGLMNTTGMYNTLIGNGAGYNATSSSNNTLVGIQAFISNTSSLGQNVALGAWNGFSNVSGHSNTFLGNYAGINNLGSENTFVGLNSGNRSTGNGTVALGHQTGYQASTTLTYANNYSVFLGYQAGYNETGSNKLYISNSSTTNGTLIYGEFDNRRVGIGTTTLTSTLNIAGTAGTPLLNIASSTGSSMFYVDKNGHVGISSSSPSARLTVVDTTATVSSPVFIISTSTTGSIFQVVGNGNFYYDGAGSSPSADYAEYFFTNDTDLSSGEVVCIDVEKENAIKRCANSSDGNLMGIVSTRPAIVGNSKKGYENNVHYKIIGMLGQVPAKASAENGEIRPGDSLTSASIPGYVMKANAGDSTVGVALEGLAKSEGVINVLISRRNKSLTVEAVEEQISERIAAMEIEDEVRIMVSQAVATLNLDFEIGLIVEEQISDLNIDNRLSIGFSEVDNQLSNISSSINEIKNRLLLAEENIDKIFGDQALIFDQFSIVNDKLLAGTQNDNFMKININGDLVIGKNESVNLLASTTDPTMVENIEIHAMKSIKLGNNVDVSTDNGVTVAVVEIDAVSNNEISAFVVNQAGDGDVADFKSNNISIMNIESGGRVTVVGSMLVDGRILICSGGVCGNRLTDSIDETMGDMGVEGKVVAGAFESICEDSYVWVEGSAKYGTLPGFCVQEDEMKIAVITEDLTEIQNNKKSQTNITQGEATLACQEIGLGYHLISENEWMTIADNIIKNNENDIDLTAPGLQLATSTSRDVNVVSSSSLGFKLSNGNTVYNFAGGLAEWTDQVVTLSGLMEPKTNDWIEYSSVLDNKGYDILPPYYYNSENGIGKIKVGTSTESNLRGFVRGESAIFDLNTSYSPVYATSTIGFRCAK